MKVFLSSLFIILSISLASTAGKGELCDYFHWCSGKLECTNRRCYSSNDLLLAKTDINVTPQGPECSMFKLCPKGLTCFGKCIDKVEEPKPPKEKKGLLQQAKKEQQRVKPETQPKPNNKTTPTPPPKEKDEMEHHPSNKTDNATATPSIA